MSFVIRILAGLYWVVDFSFNIFRGYDLSNIVRSWLGLYTLSDILPSWFRPHALSDIVSRCLGARVGTKVVRSGESR
jgi:hypothetical protein